MTPLRIGIVGLSEAARPLAEALLTSPEFQLLGYCADAIPEWWPRLAAIASREPDALSVINLPGLESLLILGPATDVKSVVVTALAHGLKVIVLPLAEYESTLAYDLSVSAIDDAAPLTPCFVYRLSPELNGIREQLLDASLVEMECELVSRAATTGPSLHWPDVRQSLLNLSDLVCWFWGDYRRVTTVTAGPDGEHPTRVTVSLGGEQCPDVVITYRPADTAKCIMQVQHPAGAKRVDLQSITIDPSLLRAGRQGELSSGGTWPDLMRAFDLLDASQRSIRRRRTVEVSRESASERSQFKTQMTTAGCGVLGFTMFAVLMLLFVGSVLDPRDSQQRESEALGLVLVEDDFESGAAELTPKAAEQVEVMSNGLTSSTAVILVEAGDDDVLDQQRVASLAESLSATGLDGAETRIIVRPLAGGAFRTLLIVGWIIGFLPLAIYLLLQTLIVVTSPPS